MRTRSTAVQGRGVADAFTLVEVLVSMAVLVLLLGIVFTVLGRTASTIVSASGETTSFQGGRAAFYVLAQKLSQATLNTYWAYDNPSSPTTYVRKSDLDFVVQTNGNYGQQVSFQAPLAYSDNARYMEATGLLNACSYSVQYSSDDPNVGSHPNYYRPGHVTNKRWRYRLIQATQPAQGLAVFSDATDGWVANLASSNWPFVDNVIAMIVWPRLSKDTDPAGTQLSANYLYSSRTGPAVQLAQLPPVANITLVLVDEKSMLRLNPTETPPAVIESALQGRFTDPTKYQSDLDGLTAALTTARIRYEVMTGAVTMKESQWSSTP